MHDKGDGDELLEEVARASVLVGGHGEAMSKRFKQSYEREAQLKVRRLTESEGGITN